MSLKNIKYVADFHLIGNHEKVTFNNQNVTVRDGNIVPITEVKFHMECPRCKKNSILKSNLIRIKEIPRFKCLKCEDENINLFERGI